MSRSEQNVILEICQTFLKDNVPEYIRDAAYYIHSEGEVQKINIQEGETWEVQGLIQGEDLQIYTPSLTLTITDRTTRHMCNCSDAFTGICRHVTALALRLAEELRKEQGDPEETPPPATDWKQSFRNFFSTEMEPEAGHHYLIFRFEPEQGRLLVSFYRGRQNKSGLSTVHTKITLEQIIQNPDWCEYSPQLPHVARQIGQHLEYYGHRVEIPQGLTSWFFWAVRKEYYLLWKDTDKPCRIETMPFALKLKPILDDSGFHFDVLLKREGRQPLPIRAGRSADRVLGEDGSQEDSAGRCPCGSVTRTAFTRCTRASIRHWCATSFTSGPWFRMKIFRNFWTASGRACPLPNCMSRSSFSSSWSRCSNRLLTIPSCFWMRKAAC